jgi:hypothetical protein
LFDGENISFDASCYIYINSTNIPPIMIINRIYETQKSSVAVACFIPGRAKDLSAPLYRRDAGKVMSARVEETLKTSRIKCRNACE